MVGINRLNPDNVDLNDEKVWQSIKDDTTLIFQWESDSAAQYLRKFMSNETIKKVKDITSNFSYIKWFSFGNGLIRPACASYRDEVAKGEFSTTGLKELDDFLTPTLGRVCMQEDIMKFLVNFCGYSQAESDTVRRGIAKKYGTNELLPEIEKRFINTAYEKFNIKENEDIASVKSTLNKLDDPKKAEKAFRKFSYLLVSNRDLRDPYFKELEKQGYSMVIDDADAMGGISKSPVIIFDRNKSLEFKEAKGINT